MPGFYPTASPTQPGFATDGLEIEQRQNAIVPTDTEPFAGADEAQWTPWTCRTC